MGRKLVSVITGTYDRHHLLYRCIENVRRQTYKEIEHCIVSDGPDFELALQNKSGWPGAAYSISARPIKFVETGRQWSQFLADSISAVPFQVAQWLASGDYLMWLADDEDITQDHVESLVNLLEEKDVDFVYSQSEIWFNPNMKPLFVGNIIGEDPPKCGRITQALFRAELLDYAGFESHVGSGTDWYQIRKWMEAGASWAFLPRVTHSHRVDKMGDKDLNHEKQKLRGQLQVR